MMLSRVTTLPAALALATRPCASGFQFKADGNSGMEQTHTESIEAQLPAIPTGSLAAFLTPEVEQRIRKRVIAQDDEDGPSAAGGSVEVTLSAQKLFTIHKNKSGITQHLRKHRAVAVKDLSSSQSSLVWFGSPDVNEACKKMQTDSAPGLQLPGKLRDSFLTVCEEEVENFLKSSTTSGNGDNSMEIVNALGFDKYVSLAQRRGEESFDPPGMPDNLRFAKNYIPVRPQDAGKAWALGKRVRNHFFGGILKEQERPFPFVFAAIPRSAPTAVSDADDSHSTEKENTTLPVFHTDGERELYFFDDIDPDTAAFTNANGEQVVRLTNEELVKYRSNLPNNILLYSFWLGITEQMAHLLDDKESTGFVSDLTAKLGKRDSGAVVTNVIKQKLKHVQKEAHVLWNLMRPFGKELLDHFGFEKLVKAGHVHTLEQMKTQLRELKKKDEEEEWDVDSHLAQRRSMTVSADGSAVHAEAAETAESRGRGKVTRWLEAAPVEISVSLLRVLQAMGKLVLSGHAEAVVDTDGNDRTLPAVFNTWSVVGEKLTTANFANSLQSGDTLWKKASDGQSAEESEWKVSKVEPSHVTLTGRKGEREHVLRDNELDGWHVTGRAWNNYLGFPDKYSHTAAKPQKLEIVPRGEQTSHVTLGFISTKKFHGSVTYGLQTTEGKVKEQAVIHTGPARTPVQYRDSGVITLSSSVAKCAAKRSSMETRFLLTTPQALRDFLVVVSRHNSHGARPRALDPELLVRETDEVLRRLQKRVADLENDGHLQRKPKIGDEPRRAVTDHLTRSTSAKRKHDAQQRSVERLSAPRRRVSAW